jgi:hypothetical protein
VLSLSILAFVSQIKFDFVAEGGKMMNFKKCEVTLCFTSEDYLSYNNDALLACNMGVTSSYTLSVFLSFFLSFFLS